MAMVALKSTGEGCLTAVEELGLIPVDAILKQVHTAQKDTIVSKVTKNDSSANN